MKYRQTVDLRSSVYKYSVGNSSTKNKNSKSPVKSSLKPTITAPNPSDLFQKVCCPNCKYLFKIIKPEHQSAITANIKTAHKKVISQSTQTEGVLTVHNSNSQSRFRDISDNSSNNQYGSPFHKLHLHQSKASHSNNSRRGRLENEQENLLETPNSAAVTRGKKGSSIIKNSDYKFKPLIASPGKSKSTHLLKTLNGSSQNEYSKSPSHNIEQNLSNQNKMPRQSSKNSSESHLRKRSVSPDNISTPRKISEKIDFQSECHGHTVSTKIQKFLKKSNTMNSNFEAQPSLEQRQSLVEPLRHREDSPAQPFLNEISTTGRSFGCNYCKEPGPNQTFQLISTAQSPEFVNYLLQRQCSYNCLKHLEQFCQDALQDQVEMPSYCKMLLLAGEDKETKKKAECESA